MDTGIGLVDVLVAVFVLGFQVQIFFVSKCLKIIREELNRIGK